MWNSRDLYLPGTSNKLKNIKGVMARLALLCVLCCVTAALADDHDDWTLDDYKREYAKLDKKLEECRQDDNPSLISWSEAETALFLLMAVVVVLLLLFAIVLINYCAEKSKKKKEDKKHLVDEARY